MPTGTFDYRSEGERRAIERAIAFVAEMHDLAQTAPDGQVLGLCEGQAVERGRDLLRRHPARGRAGGASRPRRKKRGGAAMRVRRPAPPQAAVRPGVVNGRRADPAGPMAWPLRAVRSSRLRRRPAPGRGRPADRAGPAHGRLAGLHDPFRKAERLLGELAGWSIGAEALRRTTHAEAAAAAEGRAERTALPEAFAKASGEQELHIDAGKVNTPEGWRDVKVAVFACRERGPAATAGDYEQRQLPAPTARSVVAAVEECGAFGGRCQAERGGWGCARRG